MELRPDMRIRTGPGGRAGLIMDNGVSLRLAETTEVVFVEPGHIELIAGKAYADAVAGGGETRTGNPRIIVETPAGKTWDVGTQFEVTYVQGIYRLRVREGEVSLTQASRELRSQAGEQLTIDRSSQVRRERIARDDPEWKWTESVAPDPVIDARPVSAFLEWVSRQTGRKITYTTLDLELRAETTILYGSVHGIEPLEALDTMLATTDFDYTLLDDGTILIDSR